MTAAAARKAQLGMDVPFPRDGQKEFSLRAVHIDQHFLDKRMHNTLLEPRTCGRIGSNSLELTGELVQVFVGASGSLVKSRTVLVKAHLDFVLVL